MLTSVAWLHQYLSGPRLSGERVEQLLMDLGLPSESRTSITTLAGTSAQASDEVLDVEITSNRGDCMCHLGLARELAAAPASGVTLAPPALEGLSEAGEGAATSLALENTVPEQCPLFLARVIRGVRVGESPAWLKARLEAAGQRSINNVVDVTNFIALELGTPCHAFDLAKLEGARIVVRMARKGETLTTLDAKARTLAGDEVVVADALRAQGLAGVMGGQSSEVTSDTRDVVLEMATWNPVAVRRASRRHQIRTTASARYERIVDPRSLAFACDRAAGLIAMLGGGTVAPGVLRGGAALAPDLMVRFRPSRCRQILGIDLPTERMVRHLGAIGVTVQPIGRGGEELACAVPHWRPDLTREIDLIEEVSRVEGLASVPVRESVAVRVREPQREERARREMASVLAGLGFCETVTFSFTTPALAKVFAPEGLLPVVMDDSRRGNEPALRSSVLSGLLECRRRNQHAGVTQPGGVRIFEVASTFAQRPTSPTAARSDTPASVEAMALALLLDCPGAGASVGDQQAGLRQMRGVIEALTRALAGPGVPLVIEPAAPSCKAFTRGAFARVLLGGEAIGHYGLIDRALQAQCELGVGVIGAELLAPSLWKHFPPRSKVTLPPAFPAIERDISLIVAEGVRFEQIAQGLTRHAPELMEGLSFVTTYRGKPIAPGHKSITVRLAFRDASRTLTHDEVDAPLAKALEKLRGELAFDVRQA